MQLWKWKRDIINARRARIASWLTHNLRVIIKTPRKWLIPGKHLFIRDVRPIGRAIVPRNRRIVLADFPRAIALPEGATARSCMRWELIHPPRSARQFMRGARLSRTGPPICIYYPIDPTSRRAFPY